MEAVTVDVGISYLQAPAGWLISEGEVVPENFDSSIVFNVKFSCRICLPVPETNIIYSISFLF